MLNNESIAVLLNGNELGYRYFAIACNIVGVVSTAYCYFKVTNLHNQLHKMITWLFVTCLLSLYQYSIGFDSLTWPQYICAGTRTLAMFYLIKFVIDSDASVIKTKDSKKKTKAKNKGTAKRTTYDKSLSIKKIRKAL